MVYGFTNAKEMSLGYLAMRLGLIAYLISIIRRVTDNRIRSALINAIALMILFVSMGIFKSIVGNNPVLESILWYSYYIPILMLPAVFVYIALNSGYIKDRTKIDKGYKIYFIANLMPLAMVATNNFHSWVFNVSDHINSTYTYNIGYFVIAVWIFLSVVFAITMLIYKNFTSPKKSAFLFPLIASAIIIIYTVGVILRVGVIRDLDLTLLYI